MTKNFKIIFFLLHLTASAFAAAEEITVSAERPNALYQSGEKAVFIIDAPNFTEVECRFSSDGCKTIIKNDKLVLNGGKGKTECVFDHPGFLFCEAAAEKDGKKIRAVGGAGFSVDKITPFTSVPEDYDAFWTAGKKELEKISADVKLEPFKDDSSFTSFMISFSTLAGSRLFGFLTIPKGSGPFPAYMTIASAGVGTPKEPETTLAASGVIVLNMSVHNLPLNLAAEEYKKLDGGELKGYPRFGVPDKNAFFYRKVLLGFDRAVEYIYSRPDFDKKHFVLYGGSQGGGLSLLLTGINKKITALISRVPAFSDHAGIINGQRGGWPHLVEYDQAGNDKDALLSMAAYYDTAVAVKNITVPVIMEVAFKDTICPPTGIYAAYNVLKSPKKIFHAVDKGHFGSSQEFTEFKQQWILSKLGLAQKMDP